MPPFREVGIANEHKQSKIDRKDDTAGRGQMSQAQFLAWFYLAALLFALTMSRLAPAATVQVQVTPLGPGTVLQMCLFIRAILWNGFG